MKVNQIEYHDNFYIYNDTSIMLIEGLLTSQFPEVIRVTFYNNPDISYYLTSDLEYLEDSKIMNNKDQLLFNLIIERIDIMNRFKYEYDNKKEWFKNDPDELSLYNMKNY